MRTTSKIVSLIVLVASFALAGCSGGGSAEENATVQPGSESKKNFEVGDDSKVQATPSTSTD